MLMAFTLVFAIFAYELFSVQWWNADELSQQALTQRLTRTNVPAARGTITDENGAVLARSVERRDISGDPVALEFVLARDGGAPGDERELGTVLG